MWCGISILNVCAANVHPIFTPPQTHNIALTRPIADFVVALGNGGLVVSQGSLDQALREDTELYEELKAEVENLAKADLEVDKPTADDTMTPEDGKLVVAEEIEEGHISWKARKYLPRIYGNCCD